MIYGWGRKTKDWNMPDGRVLVCSYSYFSLMFILQLVWKRRWTLIGRDRAMDTETDRAELERIYGAGNVPDIGPFERFGALIFGGAIVGLAAIVAIWGAFTSATGLDSNSTEAGGPVAEVVSSDVAGVGDDAADEDDDSSDGEAGSDSSRSISGSSTSDSDDGSSSDGGNDPDDADDADDPADPADSSGSDEEAGADGGASLASYEEASDIVPSAAPTLVSTNIDNPFQGWSEMTVHGAFATTTLDGEAAPAGEKFVVIDYQLLGIEATANFFDNAFRLFADDERFSPIAPNINRGVSGGEVVNSQIVFAVPAEVVDFTLEAGILDAGADGYQSTFDFSLTPAEAPPAPVRAGGPDMIGEVTLASAENLMTGTPHNLNPNWSPLEVEVIEATRSAKVGPNGARPGFVFVLLEVEVVATGQYGLWQTPGFRVEADGELYGHDVYINESMSTGESARASLLFEVPDTVFALQLEAGVPANFETGDRAVFDIVFD